MEEDEMTGAISKEIYIWGHDIDKFVDCEYGLIKKFSCPECGMTIKEVEHGSDNLECDCEIDWEFGKYDARGRMR